MLISIEHVNGMFSLVASFRNIRQERGPIACFRSRSSSQAEDREAATELKAMLNITGLPVSKIIRDRDLPSHVIVVAGVEVQ